MRTTLLPIGSSNQLLDMVKLDLNKKGYTHKKSSLF